MKVYITFGQQHTHSHNGKTLDKDCIGVINNVESHEQGRKLAMDWFDGVYATSYLKEDIDQDFLDLFPRGYIDLN